MVTRLNRQRHVICSRVWNIAKSWDVATVREKALLRAHILAEFPDYDNEIFIEIPVQLEEVNMFFPEPIVIYVHHKENERKIMLNADGSISVGLI